MRFPQNDKNPTQPRLFDLIAKPKDGKEFTDQREQYLPIGMKLT